MTELHPLTEKILEQIQGGDYTTGVVDQIVREHCAPLTLAVESGVAFPKQAPGAEVSVEATFIEPGNQMQMVLVGSEPVLVLQPEYDADANTIRFVLTAVALDPIGLEEVVDIVQDAVEEMARPLRRRRRGGRGGRGSPEGQRGLRARPVAGDPGGLISHSETRP